MRKTYSKTKRTNKNGEILMSKSKASQKIKCKLLVETSVESKAKICYIFKPKEVVVDENYKLGLVFTNEGDTTFNGGKIEAQISYFIGDIELQFDLEQSIPTIASNQSESVDFGIQKAESSGEAVLRVMSIISNNQNAITECYDRLGENLLDRQQDNVLIFLVASREEIYARYGFVTALFFSIISMIFSIINIIVSLLMRR